MVTVLPENEVVVREEGNYVTIKYTGVEEDKKILVSVAKLWLGCKRRKIVKWLDWYGFLYIILFLFFLCYFQELVIFILFG